MVQTVKAMGAGDRAFIQELCNLVRLANGQTDAAAIVLLEDSEVQDDDSS